MITIALAKGSLLKDSIELLRAIGLDFSQFLHADNRLLRVTSPTSPNPFTYEALLVRNQDVPVYVEYGQAQVGIVGYDVLRERATLTQPGTVGQILDLGFGQCRMAVAVPRTSPYRSAADLPPHARVASKFVGCAAEYFNQLDLPVELIPLYGSVELGPITGMADAIVDLVATGRTLQENGLVERDCLFTSTARLIVHPTSYRLHLAPLMDLITRLQDHLAC
ncbi:MAG: ATP phosphoribosyltransferase [Thermostichales cyanobacterium SZTDM-1c_bins_54]